MKKEIVMGLKMQGCDGQFIAKSAYLKRMGRLTLEAPKSGLQRL